MAADTTTTPSAATGERGIAALDSRMLDRPLEYLMVDHLRQRNLCALLDRIAEAPALDAGLAATLAEHLAHDLAIHVIDDEEDLFPLVRRRAETDDRVEDILGALSAAHAAEDRLASAVVKGLREAVAGGAQTLEPTIRGTLRQFAERLRRHVAVENALVMPLAELRLTEADLKGLSRRMAARRGIRLSQVRR